MYILLQIVANHEYVLIDLLKADFCDLFTRKQGFENTSIKSEQQSYPMPNLQYVSEHLACFIMITVQVKS